MTPEELAARIDSTDLRLEATVDDVRALCAEAADLGCAAVCVYPMLVPRAREVLRGSGVRVATVGGFPHGRSATASKEADVKAAARAGADEIDIVMNYTALRAGDGALVAAELERLGGACRAEGLTSKIIVETCFLDDARILESLRLCEAGGIDFIKTSTGLGPAGARVEHVRLWREHRRQIRIKAAGGIRTARDAVALVDAGADRLGLSAAGKVVAELRAVR